MRAFMAAFTAADGRSAVARWVKWFAAFAAVSIVGAAWLGPAAVAQEEIPDGGLHCTAFAPPEHYRIDDNCFSNAYVMTDGSYFTQTTAHRVEEQVSSNETVWWRMCIWEDATGCHGDTYFEANPSYGSLEEVPQYITDRLAYGWCQYISVWNFGGRCASIWE